MRKLSLFFSVGLVLFLVAGCNNKTQPTSADQGMPSQVKTELTAVEVLKKSAEAMNQEKGFVAQSKQEQKIKQGKVDKVVSSEMEVQVTNQPLAMHIKGTMASNGVKTPVEMITANGKSYVKLGKKWMKEPETKTEQAENPSDQLKKAQQAITALEGGSTSPQGVKVTKENGFYIVEITKEAIANEQFKAMLAEEVKQALKGSLSSKKKQNELQVDQIQFEEYNQKIWIDAQTFKYSKQSVAYSMTIPGKKSPLKLDLKLEMNVKGPFEGKIEIPVDAKKS
ncbi:DUF6612 family protein [Thermoflavimicrobium dichotomicum]|uniref:Lipoprotein n=1 Tax=Thermoflavimicrobium dichotomicum TaxID=46223 RepID=A0A1I3RM22_9BACL|nr:DUF6612 family protein [Thermoflavimicrobium dichotomicum]SFJ46912.1 hypothetical protein SAMN05421852_11083 [Thermoflavimicrobium dichotomicum]